MGAGQGIGREVSLLLAGCGARLALVDLEAERVASVADEVRERGTSAEALTADVTREEQVEATVEAAVKALGGIDVLVNIIGMAAWGPLLETDVETWDHEHSLNLRQHFLVSRAVARHMVERGQGGSIAVVASVSGRFSAPNHGAYGAAKAGLMALIQTMSQEWEPYRIRVNAVAPGAVQTPRIMAMREAGEIVKPNSGFAARECEPIDIAKALLFLSSAMARRVNGQTLVVDGGTTARFPFNLGT
jgi:3-oxoacyl-[acyl-carrier protein] reductase